MRKILSVTAAGLLCVCAINMSQAEQGAANLSELQATIEEHSGNTSTLHNFAGEFLVSHFAQSQYDWGVAKKYLDYVLQKDPHNQELLRRSMILAAGSGDIDMAVKRARALLTMEDGESLIPTILTIEALAQKDMKEAQKYLDIVSGNDMTGFIKPIMAAWIEAGVNNKSPEGLEESSIHLYHGALIALFLGNKELAHDYTEKLMKLESLGVYEGERVADLQAALGEHDSALGFYKGLQIRGGAHKALDKKIQTLQETPEDISSLLPQLKIKTPAMGVALVINDLARILYQEQSDTSTQLFTHLALVLDPDLIEARILLADTLARNKRYQEAIKQYMLIPQEHESYLESRHEIANLMADAGQVEQARSLLNNLFKTHHDVDALIRIGDLYRVEEDYKNSLEAYNKAVEYLGNDLGKNYWHLLYARGMAYEREGKWNKAEADLQQALSYNPNHPYLLNYLGYSWADQGLHLDRSLELIKKAVSLRPSDGYIVDSLGWVYYMLGRYDEALPYLEKAAGLLSYDSVINDHLGDVYWQSGRKLEARFQWERAKNYTKDEELIEVIKNKLKHGVEPHILKEAKTELE